VVAKSFALLVVSIPSCAKTGAESIIAAATAPPKIVNLIVSSIA
jgi:hypothetical protein